MRTILVIALCLSTVAALPSNLQGLGGRISGGTLTTITEYPNIVSLSYSWNSNAFWHTCVGTIISRISILTAAQCVAGDDVDKWQARIGSSFANSGGISVGLSNIMVHPNFNARTYENDIGIVNIELRTAFDEIIQPISFAEFADPPDNAIVRIPGWGFTLYGGVPSQQLREIETPVVNREFCAERFLMINEIITENMLCTGWLDDSERGQCKGDEGSPLYYNNTIVGIYSWSPKCGDSYYPSVNVRFPQYAAWIKANA